MSGVELDPCWESGHTEGVFDILTLPIQSRFQLFASDIENNQNVNNHLRVATCRSGDTNSPQALNRSLHWLEECTTTHEKCGPRSPKPFLTRVVDLRDFSWPDRNDVKLHISNGEHGVWVSLSHCWGKTPTLRTLKTTLLHMRAKLRGMHCQRPFKRPSSLRLTYNWLVVD